MTESKSVALPLGHDAISQRAVSSDAQHYTNLKGEPNMNTCRLQRLVENVGAAPLLKLPKFACYCYTTLSTLEPFIDLLRSFLIYLYALLLIGRPYALHHFLTALSLTPNLFATPENPDLLFLKISSRVSLSGRQTFLSDIR